MMDAEAAVVLEMTGVPFEALIQLNQWDYQVDHQVTSG